ncbi:acyl-CoA dehydrogenase family protein [Spongiibacter taiwanensis]|uniref:acyl-CoA dehydrogenase family protein n=1 Tax=Spongiibacter taiwanensis TaxID=1748242 RepID=UPI0020358F65|nr:acyl-CoA dehydrogenase family protein [Spongiibacter taiwanensis]USA42657.1 acyl-CoA dehydrogenase family protein [Spongiibacter taiwanensis]
MAVASPNLQQDLPLSFDQDAEAAAMAAAKAMRPLLRKHTQTHHKIGEMVAEVVAAVTEAKLHGLSVPKRWGGGNLSSVGLARVSAEVARGCPSTAWSVSITNSVAWMASQMKDSLQKAVFSKGIPMMTSPQNGAGTLSEVEGGYLLNGRWAYGSNCHHAKYALLQGMLGEQPIMCLVGIDEVRRLDTWDVVGMRGSGSDTLVAENVFVRTDHTTKMAGVSSGEPHTFTMESSDYWVAFPLLRAKALGVLVGAVEGQLDAVVAGKEKPVLYTNYPQRQDSGAYRASIGEAATKIRSARCIMDSTNKMVDDAALEARYFTVEESHHIRAEVALAIKLLSDASSMLMDLAGSSAFSESNLCQRYWLDFNVGSRHVIFNQCISYEAYGDFVLDRELSVMNPLFV